MSRIEKISPELQPELPNVNQEKERVIDKVSELGELAVSEFVELYRPDRFTFADIKSFAAENGRNTSEAGKIFSSFYRGMQELDVEPPRNKKARRYQHNRDEYKYPLALVSQVLKSRKPDDEDLYSSLLREFHHKRIESWFEKQSTSA